MLKIKIQDIDELEAISEDLEIITYLQSLVRYDISSTIEGADFYFARNRADYYLLDRQIETVLKLRRVLCNDNFINR